MYSARLSTSLRVKSEKSGARPRSVPSSSVMALLSATRSKRPSLSASTGNFWSSRTMSIPRGSVPLFHNVAWRAARPLALFSLDFRLDPALAHGLRELFQEGTSLFPADAAVRDAHAILQRLARHEVLPTGLQMAFHHDAEDA